MGYIHAIKITDTNQTHLIEPLLYATAGGTSTNLTAGIQNFELVAGAYVNIKIGSVSANAKLQVGSTTATDIYYNGVQISDGMLTEGNIYTFVYDGLYWNVLGDITGKNIMIGTSSEWVAHTHDKFPSGTIIIYTDHGSYTNDNEQTITVPGIKITDGTTPIADLPFVGDDVIIPLYSELNEHITNNVIHVTQANKNSWNNKITCGDTVTNNNLILTRD